MTEEFNLSKKRIAPKGDVTQYPPMYYEEDVKEFIKRLKTELFDINTYYGEIGNYTINKVIDKLAGKQLTEEKTQ